MKEPRTRGIQNPHLLEQRLHVHSTPSSHSRPGLHVVFTSFQASGWKPQEEERGRLHLSRGTQQKMVLTCGSYGVSDSVLIPHPTACLPPPPLYPTLIKAPKEHRTDSLSTTASHPSRLLNDQISLSRPFPKGF